MPSGFWWYLYFPQETWIGFWHSSLIYRHYFSDALKECRCPYFPGFGSKIIANQRNRLSYRWPSPLPCAETRRGEFLSFTWTAVKPRLPALKQRAPGPLATPQRPEGGARTQRNDPTGIAHQRNLPGSLTPGPAETAASQAAGAPPGRGAAGIRDRVGPRGRRADPSLVGPDRRRGAEPHFAPSLSCSWSRGSSPLSSSFSARAVYKGLISSGCGAELKVHFVG